jgi:serine/threonine-protein kinase
MAIRERPGDTAAPTELLGPPAPPPDGPPPERELWPWLIVLLVLVLAGLAAVWFATRDSGSPSSVTVQTTIAAALAKPEPDEQQTTTQAAPSTVVVPDLVGRSRDEALRTLEARGLTADLREVPSERPKDTVVSQHPAGGTRVDEHSAVLLNVARTAQEAAPTTVSVPDVTGQSVDSAKDALRAAGLKASVEHVARTEPKDTVVSQSPGAGAQANHGDHVLLNVSKGEPDHSRQTPAGVEVPRVVGEDEETAKDAIKAAGLDPKKLDQDTSDPSQDGIVIDQLPTGGSTAPPKSHVTIHVGRYRND